MGTTMRRCSKYFFEIPWVLLRLTLIISAVIFSSTLWLRTTNQWALKNLGDTFLRKHIGRRPIVLTSHYRPPHESSGNYLVVIFLGDTRMAHELYCFSNDNAGNRLSERAYVQRIHEGKRAANDICSWSGFLAECKVAARDQPTISISTVENVHESIEIHPEPSYQPSNGERHKLVVCIAPMYIYTDWQIMLLGMETWLALGATKIIVPIQSCTDTAHRILQHYAKDELVIIRSWPKWPLLSDVNPNGLILSRGIEESHVSCLHFVKPWADLVVFSDFDDMLIPYDPSAVHPLANVEIIEARCLILYFFIAFIFQKFAQEHPQAGSFLFEHRDVQLILPKKDDQHPPSLANFNFDFLSNTNWKTLCRLVRQKTRVIVNASRVDSVNMHETGIHRFGYVQVRVPCREAHFYHMRHSYKNIGVNEKRIDLTGLAGMINRNFASRLTTTLKDMAHEEVNVSSTDSFADFDKCMGSINGEHWTLSVSRCLTPHVCHDSHPRRGNVPCVATTGLYRFKRTGEDYVIVLQNTSFIPSLPNCEAPHPELTGDYFYMP